MAISLSASTIHLTLSATIELNPGAFGAMAEGFGFSFDLLPLHRPDWLSRNTVVRYRSWLGILAGTANGFLCNSEQTRFELAEALAREFGLAQGYDAAVLPMSYSISPPCSRHSVNAKPVLARDIPIFHTFAANGVYHFPANADHSTLARSIHAWVHGIRAAKLKSSHLGQTGPNQPAP